MPNPSVLYEMTIDLSTQKWGVDCPLDQTLIGPMQYGWDRFKKDQNSLTFGGGLLAGSPLPGTRRMIFCGYSPAWEGFYVSALGGAMYVFHRVGVNYVWLRGQSAQDVVLVIKLENGEYSVRFDPIQPEAIWPGYTDRSGRTWQGFYALQQSLFEKYQAEYKTDSFRILTVGPGARLTKEGAIGSNQIKRGELSAIEDWAGGGGLGSRLLQYHHVAGIVFGGDWQDPALKEARELDEYFLTHFGQRAILADLALSQKYRYVPKFETGGTFGVNMHEAEDRLFSFNYRSIYASDDQRLAQHDNFIAPHYLKQFNEETIVPRNFDHCGEPCAIACKKFVGEFKKDYEPYEALGPNSGIFDQRAAEKINKYVDSMGLDSIQTGGTVAWIMELLAEKLIPAADFGLPAEGPRFQFAQSTDEFDLVADSAYNANYAIRVVDMILYHPAGEPFRRGMRYAAKWLDQKYGIRSLERAVFNAHGAEGCMVPNQYWVPGMFSPMPLMGKYFSFYGFEFYPPYELGKKNVERFVYELYSENSGSCRFHRKWVEDIIDDIILSHFELNFNYWDTNFRLAKEIHQFQSAASVPWESERVVDIIFQYLEKWQRIGLNHPALAEWLGRFRTDKLKAAREYWQEMYRGMSDAFEQGVLEPAHIEHGFIKK
jgi:glyceraldehyde-3-phosphate dehydrogenase (ferredoxin)